MPFLNSEVRHVVELQKRRVAKTQKQSTRLCRLVIGPANSHEGMILHANVPPRGRKADTIRLESGASQNLAGPYTVQELAVEGGRERVLKPKWL